MNPVNQHMSKLVSKEFRPHEYLQFRNKIRLEESHHLGRKFDIDMKQKKKIDEDSFKYLTSTTLMTTDYLWFKYDLCRRTTHPKFDLILGLKP